MADREKVMWSLARCSCGVPDACSDCCYDNWPPRICVQHLTNDALTLLKAQQPRVMTLDEIHGLINAPMWRETKSRHKDLYNGWMLAYDIQKGMGITGIRLGMCDPSRHMCWCKLDDYGKTWRCWNAEPTEEQMEAVQWND